MILFLIPEVRGATVCLCSVVQSLYAAILAAVRVVTGVAKTLIGVCVLFVDCFQSSISLAIDQDVEEKLLLILPKLHRKCDALE